MRAWTWLLLLALAIPVAPARACLWDDDTLEDERRGLPGMAALLADKYERHSAFYYEHRIAQSRNKLAANPKDGRAHDNLSVALDKLGRHEEAREALLAKDRLLPGEYTTHANLGTVCYHLGKLEEAVGHIERALAINKEAHFGREEYQLRIVKQMLAVHRDPREAEKGPLGEPFDGNHRGDLDEWRQRSGLKSDP
ncbi:MAG: tetratricopeptide repeat protein, partial [Chloroflexota bacterium]